MNRGYGKNLKEAAALAAVMLVAIEVIALIITLLDPRGTMIRFDFENPVHHLTAVGVSLLFGLYLYIRSRLRPAEGGEKEGEE